MDKQSDQTKTCEFIRANPGATTKAIRSAIWGRKLPAHIFGKRQIVLREDLEKCLANAPTAHIQKVA